MKTQNKFETVDRHGHLITPGSAEGERETIEQALKNAEFSQRIIRNGRNRPRIGKPLRHFPAQAGNRKAKKAA